MEMENEMNTYRSSCPVAHNLANSRSNEEPESVDLLQMVPDASRSSPGRSLDGHRGSCGTIPHYPKTRSLDNSSGQRMHFVLLPREEVGDIDADSGVHICHTCRDSDIYNSQIQQQQQPQQTPGSVRHVYASRTLPDRTASHDDGSIYFNYLRFANTSSRTSPCTNSSTYEPVVRNGRPAKRGSHFKWFGSCCVRKSKPRKPTATAVQYAPGMDSHDDSDHVLQPKPSGKSKPRDWRRIKRLLLLAGVLLGILVALGGMVVGFLVLSPKNNGDGACEKGYVQCGKDRCVLVNHVCQGHANACPEVDRSAICPHNNTRSDSYGSDAVASGKIVIQQEKPLKGLGGWVQYSQGSVNGSKYLVLNKAMTFFAAQEECRKKGGYLAHINTIREQIFIEELLKQELLNLDISQDGVGFWLGARRARGSHSGTCMYDQWKWVDPHNRPHGVINGFTAFVPGKPDNYFDPEECLYISYQDKSADSYLKWDDTPCDIHSIGGIKVLCEAELR